jgi:hypothetical protein
MHRFFVVLLIAVPALLFAQGPDTLWTRHYGGAGDEICHAIRPTRDGGFILVGSTTSVGAGGTDAYALVTTANGTPSWSAHFGGAQDDESCDVIQLPTYEYVFAGTTHSDVGDGGEFWLLETSSQGDSLWSHTYSGTDDQRCTAFQATMDGGFILGGIAYEYMGPGSNILLVKTDSWGNSSWIRLLGDTTTEQLSRVLQMDQGGYMLVGSTDVVLGPQTGPEPFATKVNSTGYPTWNHLFEGIFPAHCTSARQAPAGGYIFSVTADRYSHGEVGMYKESMLIKMTFEGVEEWLSICGVPYDDELNDVVATPDGAFIGAGSRQLPQQAKDGFIVRVKNFGNSGDTVWTRTLGGNNDDEFTSALVSTGGRCALAGNTWSHSNGDESDFWLVMMDSVYTLGAGDRKDPFPAEYSIAAYPNPFNSSARIRFNLPRDGQVTLTVYDIEGRMAGVLADGWLTRGSHTVNFDGGSLASGLYFCRLASAGETRTAKVMLLK